jgi:hypothetical protein
MSPASGADNAGEPMLMSQVRKVGANSCGRRSVSFCTQKGGGASILLLKYELKSRNGGRRDVGFVRLALKVVMQNYENFVEVILLY